MGNSESCGFGVLNSTQHKLTVCLTMGPTHYWEENVMPGKIFYRWPGAVWYTVYVYPTNGIHVNKHTAGNFFDFNESKLTGVDMVDIPTAYTFTAVNALRDAGVVLEHSTEIALLDSYGISAFKCDEYGLGNLKTDVVQAFKRSRLKRYERYLYGGGDGTWLEVKGLPRAFQRNDGKVSFRRCDIDIHEKSFNYVMKKGTLTEYSYSQYHIRH